MSKLSVAAVFIRSHAVVVAQRHLTGLHIQNVSSRCSLTGLYSCRSRSTFNDIIIVRQHDFYSETPT